MVKQQVEQAVAQSEAGLAVLSQVMTDPTEVPFDEVTESFEKLEATVNTNAHLDATFVWLAERAEAGRLVGSLSVLRYLTRTPGLPRREARARLWTGHNLFSPPPPPPEPEPGESEEERRVREEAERARAARERRAQEETRLKAASAPGERPGANLPDEGAEDTRTRAQRRVAQLAVILKRHLASQQVASRYGVGSTLLSFTTADLTDLSPTSEFNTNTGDRLNVVDLLRLGAAEFDVTALHDTGGQPRALGRTNRLASFFQRVALYAAQGVCGCPNCASAAIHNDAHHIQAWDHGVPTDLHNLTLVCPPSSRRQR